jgi:predicted nucleotidyltransferase component of viral defense system
LVFRGGTAFHKLHLPFPLRYSEDLDYVRSTASTVGPLLTTLRQIGDEIGFKTNSQVGAHPRVLWRTATDDGVPLRIKIEMNTHERSPALPHVRVPFRVVSRWWSDDAEILSFQTPELAATKIRALYQRSKGRDLFDLWLALTQLRVDPTAILGAFTPLPSRRVDFRTGSCEPPGQSRGPAVQRRHHSPHCAQTHRLRRRCRR